jgi:hypothetical protein
MPLEDMPQVSTTPEPISQVPKVDVAQFKNLDDLINGILDEIGNKGSALAIAAAGKATDVVANGVDRIASAASAYNPNFVPSGSSQVGRGNSQDAPSQGRGRDVGDSQQVGASQSESVNVPSQKREVTQISAATHIDDAQGGYLQPNVNFNKGPAQGQGIDR